MRFRHAGDLGDIIFSLPAMRAMGGGILCIEAATYTRQVLTPDNWCGIDHLLRMQPYITDVQPWTNAVPCHVNLNDFRARMMRSLRSGQHKDKALVDWFLESHGLSPTAKDEAWLEVPPNKVAKVVFNRTGVNRKPGNVYLNHLFPWHRVWQIYGEHAVFIGHPEEYEVFCHACGYVDYYPTANLLEAARVIAGAEIFVGNQSVCHAIAEGLKKQIVLEVWREGPNCLHHRPGVYHGWDHSVGLPPI
jgi:hypothetical protein